MKTACLPLIAALSWALTAHAAVPDRAGEVTFLIGEARITSGPDTGSTLRRGSAVLPGQQIETSDNGHLHIRFVDGAAVAVRPMTRLRIDDYTYAPNDPSQNRIRFFLQEGALRSITGKAGEANKDRFRINTPVAAIGIRGTDFNVQTTGDLTRASLFQGAIVLAPLGGQCSALTLGPCVGTSALELDEQRRGLFAIQAGALDRVAHLVPKRLESAAPEAPVVTASRVVAMTDTREAAKHQSTAFATENVATTRADQLAEVVPSMLKALDPDGNSKPGPSVEPPRPTPEPESPVVKPEPPVVTPEPPIAKPEPPVVTPEPPRPVVPIVLTAEANRQIWWGRWAAYADPADASTSYENQRRPGRDEAAGGNTVFAMLRSYSSRSQLPISGGQASFSLSLYEAYTLSNNTLTPATITAAGLSMNFDTRRFSTFLDVSPGNSSALNLSAAGRIESDGRFYSDGGQGMSLNGALANRGQQAGYAFERALSPNATLLGATAWTR